MEIDDEEEKGTHDQITIKMKLDKRDGEMDRSHSFDHPEENGR